MEKENGSRGSSIVGGQAGREREKESDREREKGDGKRQESRERERILKLQHA